MISGRQGKDDLPEIVHFLFPLAVAGHQGKFVAFHFLSDRFVGHLLFIQRVACG